MKEILSQTELWQDFDKPFDLEVNLTKTTETEQYVWQSLFFSSHVFDDGCKSRIFAKLCYKNTSSKKPALLIVGSPRQKAPFAQLEYWAEKGYVAMTIDLKGQTDKGIFSLYPHQIAYLNDQDCPNDFFIGDNARQTRPFNFAVICRRAISYLTSLDFVKSVSLLSIGNADSFTLAVMATDDRLQSGAVLFGSLSSDYPENGLEEVDTVDELNTGEMNIRTEQQDNKQIWEVAVNSTGYLSQITIPLYVIVSGNSKTVDAVETSQTFSRSNGEKQLLVIPNAIDCLTPKQTENLNKWFKGRRQNSDVELSFENGSYLVRTATPEKNLEFWYCRCGNKAGRNWLNAPLMQTGDNTYAVKPVGTEKTEKFLALVKLDGEIAVSTAIVSAPCTDATETPSPLIYTGESNGRFVETAPNGSPFAEETARVKGYLDILGTKGKSMLTFAPSDPIAKVTSGAVSFDLCCNAVQTLTVACITNYPNEKKFSAKINLDGNGKWQKIVLETHDFVCNDEQLPEDCNVDAIEFCANEDFIVNNVFLV